MIDKMEVKIFEADTAAKLETQVNEFMDNLNGKAIIDSKYSCALNNDGSLFTVYLVLATMQQPTITVNADEAVAEPIAE